MRELIEAINRLRPFELGDDPYAHAQNDTIERVLDLIRQEYPEREVPQWVKDFMMDRENERRRIDAEMRKCNHSGPDGSYYGENRPRLDDDYSYTYCPKCGIKL